MLFSAKSQLEQDLALIDELLLQSAEACNHLAAVLRNGNERFWGLPTERLLAVLNADVPRTLAIFSANTATASSINAQLDQLGEEFPGRAPVESGRADIVFDPQAGVFVLAEPSPASEAEE